MAASSAGESGAPKPLRTVLPISNDTKTVIEHSTLLAKLNPPEPKEIVKTQSLN